MLDGFENTRIINATTTQTGDDTMLVTKDKLEQLEEKMTTEKARRAVAIWAGDHSTVTLDTLNAIDDVNDSGLLLLLKFIKVEMRIRGLEED